MRSIDKSNITAVILAGGQSSRMNGEDKGLILLKNKPLISYVVDVVVKKVASILVSANRNIDLYQEFGKVITDELSDFQGPLAGISAAMDKSSTKYLLVLPCDGPFINSELIDRLVLEMERNNGKICVASDGDRMHPTFSLINTDLKNDLSKFLDDGNRKLGLWFRNNNAIEVDFSDQIDVFINLNSPEDFKISD